MGLSWVQSRALLGLAAPAVTVEVHLANGLPSFTLVGLAEVEVKEARERVRSALLNSGLTFPHNQRITVNLAPADLPKDSGAVRPADRAGHPGRQRADRRRALAGWAFAGELSLSGERPGARRWPWRPPCAACSRRRGWCCRPAAPTSRPGARPGRAPRPAPAGRGGAVRARRRQRRARRRLGAHAAATRAPSPPTRPGRRQGQAAAAARWRSPPPAAIRC
jgi:magnesium chelatase family protein